MIGGLATALIIGALLLAAACVIVAIRNRAMGVVLLIGLGVLELGLLVQAGIGVAKVIGGQSPHETATFIGYLAGTVVIPPVAAVWALAERTRWGPAVAAVACFAIPVMVGRLLQIWQGTA
ncbi:hypothetical protein Ssi03_52240 [Sphaerisporangium siamense]|uniref:Integral membrane protein n=1 Tax=Sphaerisporangium siamense TaxID=795645 RepID=A0A7W7D871_9ACTN|nr:hypothetical protein [Sphaerisporangium siamense]MBB4702075.1 hypothetical protein [Sphaerisporangium siamense]GII87234.1 hypothetical protein Ssi03_52240 [Sphaerisporangium siamense]